MNKSLSVILNGTSLATTEELQRHIDSLNEKRAQAIEVLAEVKTTLEQVQLERACGTTGAGKKLSDLEAQKTSTQQEIEAFDRALEKLADLHQQAVTRGIEAIITETKEELEVLKKEETELVQKAIRSLGEAFAYFRLINGEHGAYSISSNGIHCTPYPNHKNSSFPFFLGGAARDQNIELFYNSSEKTFEEYIEGKKSFDKDFLTIDQQESRLKGRLQDLNRQAAKAVVQS